MAAELFQWVTPAGEAYRLDSNVDGVQIVDSVSGRGLPPIRRTTEIVPLQPGTRTRSTVHDESEVAVGIYIAGSDATDLRAKVRSWLRRLDPTAGPGTLRITDPAGTVRELRCLYSDGLELVEDIAMRQDQLAVVTFVASDPYWMDDVDTTSEFTAGDPPTFFPFFPLRLGASQIFGASTITNQGDVDTYPVWTVTGPGSMLVLTNTTTGRTLEWDGTLGDGETLTLDARGGNQSTLPKSVVKNDGSNQFGFLSQFDFWPFVPGLNSLMISMAAATGDSVVNVTYRARYLGA